MRFIRVCQMRNPPLKRSYSVGEDVKGKVMQAISWVYRDNNTHVAIQLAIFWLAMFAVIMLGRYLMAGLIAIAVIGSIAIFMRDRVSRPSEDASYSS